MDDMSACKAAMAWIKSRKSKILEKKSLQLAVSADKKVTIVAEPRRRKR
jgi:hypothetical protein